MLSWDALREDAAQDAALHEIATGARVNPRWKLANLYRHERAEKRAIGRYVVEHRHDDEPVVLIPKRRYERKLLNGREYMDDENRKARERRRARVQR